MTGSSKEQPGDYPRNRGLNDEIHVLVVDASTEDTVDKLEGADDYAHLIKTPNSADEVSSNQFLLEDEASRASPANSKTPSGTKIVRGMGSQIITRKDLKHTTKTRYKLINNLPKTGKKIGRGISHRFVDLKGLYDWYRSGWDTMYVGDEYYDYGLTGADLNRRKSLSNVHNDSSAYLDGSHSYTYPKSLSAREDGALTMNSLTTKPDSHSKSKVREITVEFSHGSNKKERNVTAVHAFFVAIKAFVGTGILFLPKAFFNGGILFSSILMGIIAYSTLHCMLLLAETSKFYNNLSFGDIGGKLYGPLMKNLVFASICLSQAGFCCAYYIFVSQNITDFVLLVTDCKLLLQGWITLFGQLVFTIPLCLVRNVGGFSTTSIVGDVIIISSLAYIVGFCIWKIYYGEVASRVILFNFDRFTYFIGSAMFSFEGIALVTPLADSMMEPKKLAKVLKLCIISVLIIFVLVGALGYWVFGDNLETNVVLNLPNNVPGKALRLIYSVAIALSFPLLLHPCTIIIEKNIFKDKSGRHSPSVKWQKNLFRTAEVTVLALISYLGSSRLENVVNLIGCFACIPIAFIYPSLFHVKIAKNNLVKAKDWTLVVVGTIVMVYTTYLTISSLIFDNSTDVPKSVCSNN